MVLLGLTRAVACKKPIFKKTTAKITFDQLFSHSNNNITKDFKCDSCGYNNEKLETKTFYNFDQTVYLILRIELCLNSYCFLDHIKITDFNPDRIKIPGAYHYFRLMTAILFYPYDINQPKNGGHYTCLKRIENSREWIEIDDLKASAKIYPEFVMYLSNVYILVLEKI
jgi:hypothetical protein